MSKDAVTGITFGKHRGVKWAEVPDDYLRRLSEGYHRLEADWRHGANPPLHDSTKAARLVGLRQYSIFATPRRCFRTLWNEKHLADA